MAQAKLKKGRTGKRRLRDALAVPGPGMLRWALLSVSILVLVASAAWGVTRLGDPTVLPLRVVRIDGDFRYLNREALERAVARWVRGGFFGVDLYAVRRAAEQLAWVDRVRVRRIWPDTLKITVTEQVPLARWGKRRLVNPRGELFRPEDGVLPQGLPVLWGREETAPLVTAGFVRLRRMLAARGLRIAVLRRNVRGAWQLSLTDGLGVKLGSRHVEERLARFVRLYPVLPGRQSGTLQQVDMRYTNGFAVRREIRERSTGTSAAGRSRPSSDEAHKLLTGGTGRVG